MDIKIRVTQERFDEIISIEDWVNFDQLTNVEAYGYVVQFVVGEDGKYLSAADARKLFKKVPKKEWNGYVDAFISSVQAAFVNPTSGGDSGSTHKATESPRPDGSQSS